MSTIRVGVVRGGPSYEYDVSLKSGAAALSGLAHAKLDGKYAGKDILISKEGVWHVGGVPVEPQDVFSQVDVFVNALHGPYGEDGIFQSLLDRHDMPYTGSRSLPSAVGMNKILAKKIFKQHGIQSPRHVVVEKEIAGGKKIAETASDIFNTFSMPVVVKPASGRSSAGISGARMFAELEPAIRLAMEHSKTGTVLVEEFISGREAAVGVIDRFRGQALYSLPVVEVRRDRASGGGGREIIVPGHFTSEEKAALEGIARDIHTALGLRHYSLADFIVTPRRGIYALEVNTLPDLAAGSFLPEALASVGAGMPDFLDHIIGLALEEK